MTAVDNESDLLILHDYRQTTSCSSGETLTHTHTEAQFKCLSRLSSRVRAPLSAGAPKVRISFREGGGQSSHRQREKTSRHTSAKLHPVASQDATELQQEHLATRRKPAAERLMSATELPLNVSVLRTNRGQRCPRTPSTISRIQRKKKTCPH